MLKHIYTERSTDVHTDSPAEEEAEAVTQNSEGLQPIVIAIYYVCSYVISVATDILAEFEMRESGTVTEGM